MAKRARDPEPIPELIPAEPPTTADVIREECNLILSTLLDKNRRYGDSAINPKRVFAKRADPLLQIDVRIDDKISRIESAQDDDEEDAEFDLIGYLLLKRVARRIHRGG